MIKVVVNGGCGKMGKRIIALSVAEPAIKVIGALERSGHPEIGQKIEGVIITDDPGCIAKADMVIDFTSAPATVELLKAAKKYKKALVIGTTGLTPDEIQKICDAAKTIPILFSPNMSKGVNLLFRLIQEAAARLKDYHVVINETHHVHKKDAPSGTAKKIAKIIEENSGIKVEDINSIREGEIIGDHEVIFESDLDKITLIHSAKTRDVLAQGAIDAAKWLSKKPAGLYSMQDVLSE